MEQKATTHILVIHKLVMEDCGEYTCDTGDKKTTATLTVKGNSAHLHLIYVSSPLGLTLPKVDFTFIHSIINIWIKSYFLLSILKKYIAP